MTAVELLLGAPRARLLEALCSPATTTALARRLGHAERGLTAPGRAASRRAGGPAPQRADRAVPDLGARPGPARPGAAQVRAQAGAQVGLVRAVVYSGYGIMPELTQVADPACPPDGVVIAVGATGVCRVGLARLEGARSGARCRTSGARACRGDRRDRLRSNPLPGRGSGDRAVRVGCGRVRDTPPEPATPRCARGRPSRASPAGTVRGAGRVRGRTSNLVRLPDEVDFVSAAALGCRFATASARSPRTPGYRRRVAGGARLWRGGLSR